jgi:hypothetical protein
VPDIYKIPARKNRTVWDVLADDKWIKDLKANLDVQHEPQLTLLAQMIDTVQLNETRDDIFLRFGKRDEYSAQPVYMMNFMDAMPTDYRGTIWKGWAPANASFSSGLC